MYNREYVIRCIYLIAGGRCRFRESRAARREERTRAGCANEAESGRERDARLFPLTREQEAEGRRSGGPCPLSGNDIRRRRVLEAQCKTTKAKKRNGNTKSFGCKSRAELRSPDSLPRVPPASPGTPRPARREAGGRWGTTGERRRSGERGEANRADGVPRRAHTTDRYSFTRLVLS